MAPVKDGSRSGSRGGSSSSNSSSGGSGGNGIDTSGCIAQAEALVHRLEVPGGLPISISDALHGLVRMGLWKAGLWYTLHAICTLLVPVIIYRFLSWFSEDDNPDLATGCAV